MLSKLQRRVRDEKGFTLIELLVVILIIGILAAIAIPAFLGQRARAQDTAAKSAVREAATAIETYATDNGGLYGGATKVLLEDIEESLKSTPGTSLVVSAVTDTTYNLKVVSDSTNTFSVVKVAGAVTRPCERINTKGGCKVALTW